jgi:hypothetical protein
MLYWYNRAKIETEANMPVTRENPAPYAPAKTILDIIDRHRERGLPTPIDKATLERASVPETLIPRVLQSLQLLDLMTDDGRPTPVFEGIRLASEGEYKKRLEEWLKGTYADIFSFVDPTKDDETRIRDAFRHYQPVGQQGRMVTLFTGLCIAAGLIAEKPSRAVAVAAASTPRAPRPTGKRTVPARSKDTPHTGNLSPALPAPLAGLLADLPPNGWTSERRAKFMKAFETVLDLCIPVVATVPREADDEAA